MAYFTPFQDIVVVSSETDAQTLTDKGLTMAGVIHELDGESVDQPLHVLVDTDIDFSLKKTIYEEPVIGVSAFEEYCAFIEDGTYDFIGVVSYGGTSFYLFSQEKSDHQKAFERVYAELYSLKECLENGSCEKSMLDSINQALQIAKPYICHRIAA